ncbi:hypothetical protein ACOSP7_025906 [Xanthoceras sorbifolium]
MDILSWKYHVIEINHETQLLQLARMEFSGSICPETFTNNSLDDKLFSYTINDEYATLLYDCNPTENPSYNKFSCPINNIPRDAYFNGDGSILGGDITSRGCNITLVMPVLVISVQGFFNRSLTIDQVINGGFEVRWNIDAVQCEDCIKSGGNCGYNTTVNAFSCFCPDRAYSRACRPPTPTPTSQQDNPADAPFADNNVKAKETNIRKKVKIGIGAGFGGMGLMAMIFLIYLYSYRKKYAPSPLVSRNTSSDPSSKDDLEKADKLLGVHVFTYTELEEATNNFDSSRELGDGGFGTVYYGKLRDGRTVAVKRLYENNYRRVEQFMNEVEILTRLHHRNLVILYGCTSRHSRELLLVYEYISNGTVADHLHGDRSKPGAFPWATRLNIAVETASALMYLHASDIIHRDVKTNNILLDNNFCVKVADFGLSRLFPNHVTHVSTAPQGTPGYVDPEYHQCYQLTDKSDVFSFGVVLVELISSMPAVDITRHRHEINLSNLAINKIQNKALDELVDPTLGFESDYKVRKMIYAVAELAFQCLQGDKDMRPSMSTVLEILKDIQSDGYSKEKAEEFDISDDVELLKNGPPTPSPDSRISSKITLPTSD